MGSSKGPSKGAGRDAPEASSTHSMNSLQEGDEYDQPPPYTDAVAVDPKQQPGPHLESRPPIEGERSGVNAYTIYTQAPAYTHPQALYDMLCAQSQHPPRYEVTIHGSHSESTRQNNKDTTSTITDFDITIDLTTLLLCGHDSLQLLEPGARGYRGTIFPSRGHPTTGAIALPSDDGDDDDDDDEGAERGLDPTHAALRAWCRSYCASRAALKRFRFEREVTGHDTAGLTGLVTAAVRETQYRGSVRVSFALREAEVLVLSPGRVNYWRSVAWMRWVFYLTFLWVLAWPVLFLATKKWGVVKAVYPYRGQNRSVGAAMTEGEWFRSWENAVKRAARARLQGRIDDGYRLAAEELVARERRGNSGNAVSVSQMMSGWGMGEWGHDC